MKISKILHILTSIVGAIGVVTFLSAVFEGGDNLVFGVTKFDALFCATVLFLIAIWVQLGAMHHMMLEKKGEIV